MIARASLLAYAQRWAVPMLLTVFCVGTVGTFWHLSQRVAELQQAFPVQGTELHLVMVEEFRKVYSDDVVECVKRWGYHTSHESGVDKNAIPLPATLTMALGKRLNEVRPGAHLKLYSYYPFPWRTDGGPRDDFEREALAALRQHPDQPFYRFEDVEGRPSLRYAMAERLQAN